MISVIIVAHNRRKYLREAIVSVLNQSFNKDRYEIIVVKNFFDKEIDDFISSHGVRWFYAEDTKFGEEMRIGIEESVGDIICPLDDDDMFHREKLSSVYKAFSGYKELGYYHNDRIVVHDTSEKFSESGIGSNPDLQEVSFYDDRPNRVSNKGFYRYYTKLDRIDVRDLLFRYRADFNTSSIAIRSDLASECISRLKSVKISADTFFLFFAIENHFPIMVDFDRLTYYRVATVVPANVKLKTSIFEMQYDDAVYFKKIFKSQLLTKFCETLVTQRRILNELMIQKYTTRQASVDSIRMLKDFLQHRTRWSLFLSSLSLISAISPELARNTFREVIRINFMIQSV